MKECGIALSGVRLLHRNNKIYLDKALVNTIIRYDY